MVNTEKIPNEGPDKEKRNRFTGILALVFFLSSCILGWLLFKQQSITKIEITKNVTLIEEKTAMQQELIKLLADYEDLEANNAEISRQLEGEKEKIKEMLKNINRLEANVDLLKKYKREADALRGMLKGYLYRIDSLNTTIQNLNEENTQVHTTLKKEKTKTQKLEKEKEDLSVIVKEATMLRAVNVDVFGVRFKSGGAKERQETRARKIEKLKICFTIAPNELAQNGSKEIYLRVADKEGNVFPMGGDSSNVFTHEGKELVYSAKRAVTYQNDVETELCFYFAKEGPFEPEKYTVDIFIDNRRAGEGGIILVE